MKINAKNIAITNKNNVLTSLNNLTDTLVIKEMILIMILKI